jgi:hypothetical protein
MSLFGKFNLEDMIEKAMEHIDMEEITAQVMADLKITDLEMFFVIDNLPDCEVPDLVGMAYSLKSARELQENAALYSPEILKLDIAKLVPLAKDLGFVEVVS